MNCLRKLLVLLAAAANLAFSVGSAVAAPASKFQSMSYIGVVESATVPANPSDPVEVEKAQWMVAAAKQAGAKTVKIIRYWNETDEPGTDELQAVCVTARAMTANGMKALIITLMPTKYSWPTEEKNEEGRSELQRFNDTIGHYNNAFFGTQGCVSKLQLQVMWQPGNEPNISTFCRTGIDKVDDDENGRHAGCARFYVSLQQSVYRFIQEQEKLYGVNIPVLGAGIGSHHNPVSFMHHTNNAMREGGYKHPGMDIFGFHPYALHGSRNPISGLNHLPKVMNVVRAVLGKNLPFMYDEMGYETVTPAGKRDVNCTSPHGLMLIPEPHYASWARVTLKMSKNQGSVGYLNFLLADEKCENPGWQSGFYYWDRTPKPFLGEVSQVMRSYSISELAVSPPPAVRPFG